jgi:hypothetical protein
MGWYEIAVGAGQSRPTCLFPVALKKKKLVEEFDNNQTN